MLWYSRELGNDERPAILALNAQRVGGVLRAEALYVGAKLPPGPQPGTFIRDETDPGTPMTITWPTMPWAPTGVRGRLHPSTGWTPDEIIRSMHGIDYVDLPIAQ